MSPKSPEPPDSSRPSSKQSSRGNRIVVGQTEKDLWDFDDDSNDPATPEIVELTPAEESQAVIPESRSKLNSTTPAPQARTISPAPRSSQPSKQSSWATESRTPSAKAPHRLKQEEFSDLGDLEDTPDLPLPVRNRSVESAPESAPPPAPDPASPSLEEISEPSPELPEEQVTELVLPNEPDEANPPPPPGSFSLKEKLLGLTTLERACVGILMGILLGTVIFLFTSVSSLPTRSDSDHVVRYPIQGQNLKITGSSTYWREPNANTVRRETKLIPAISLKCEGGPSAIRIIFRDDQGESIGDGVTRSLSTGTHEIAATAGLDDLSTLSAYRIGEVKPWKIEVFEGPSVDAKGSEFKKLAEIPVSTDRH